MQDNPPIDYESRDGEPKQKNRLAIGSLVLALFGFVIPVIPGAAGIALGVAALRKTRDPAVGGKGIAIAGISLGGTTMVLGGCFLAVLAISLGRQAQMLQQLGRARESSLRVECAAQMRDIGQALLLYANDHRGHYPTRLEDLLLDGDVEDSRIFVCPGSSDTPALGATRQAQAAALSSGGHESYIYLPNAIPVHSNTSVSADIVVLYEPPTNHPGDGMNVLFSDGRVEELDTKSATGLLAELKAGFNPPRSGHY